jgi:multiple sugar transport system ATP-binding protein
MKGAIKPRGLRCGSVETCRKAIATLLRDVRDLSAEAGRSKPEAMATVTLKDVVKVYDNDVTAVHEFNLEIQDKEFVVLVGPSGCGKSTTLRMIAGLEDISSGELLIGGKLVNDVPPKDRDIAMVFQNYALYPHLSVYDNMAFALKLRKKSKHVIDEKVRNAAEILGITDLLDRRPKALSGGQRQRVAIGRAIVREPQVFLMDEPLSNLDAKLRNQMRAELILLRQRIDTTFVYVTHDQIEAMTLGDRIVIMKDGYIQQVGSPQDVFQHPANIFVGSFIGSPQMNFFDARLEYDVDHYAIHAARAVIGLPDSAQQSLKARKQQPCDVRLGVRPEHMILVKPDNPDAIHATVDVSEMMGSEVYLHVKSECGDCVIRLALVDLPEEHKTGFKHGDEINFTFGGAWAHLFDPKTEENLLLG